MKLSLLLATAAATACGEPQLRVGAMECSAPEPTDTYYGPVSDWSTSFENGFCDYTRAHGRCYGDEETKQELVTSPTHSGRRAAAYTIHAEHGVADLGEQSRCFIEGALPDDAIYGAWFYLPAGATDLDNWNLFHMPAGTAPGPETSDGIWDVSIEVRDDMLSLYVRDFLNDQTWQRAAVPVPVPIGAWFHVELRWRRAADETGIVELFQDGQLLWREDERITDASPWAQWYVGNFAYGLTPASSTIYVDDVTVRPAP